MVFKGIIRAIGLPIRVFKAQCQRMAGQFRDAAGVLTEFELLALSGVFIATPIVVIGGFTVTERIAGNHQVKAVAGSGRLGRYLP